MNTCTKCKRENNCNKCQTLVKQERNVPNKIYMLTKLNEIKKLPNGYNKKLLNILYEVGTLTQIHGHCEEYDLIKKEINTKLEN